MTGGRTAAIVLLVLCAVCVGHALHYYPQLPERIASHFGSSGEPDGWSSKTEFITVYLGTAGFTVALFLGAGLLMKKVPDKAINMPRKDYWLAPERREQTLADVSARLTWLASLTVLLLIDTFHQTIMVNLGQADTLTHPWLSLGLYAALFIVWIITMLKKYLSRPEPGMESQ